MNNINISIQQSKNITEQVNYNIIDKLFDISKYNNNENTTLTGNINSLTAYRDAVDYLRSNYQNLIINIIDNNYYIRFEDNEVFNVLINSRYYTGDGIGVTEDNAANMLLDDIFQNNENIISFNELKYFTRSITNNTYLMFSNCTNLKFIDISYNTHFRGNAFGGCTNLEYFHGRNSTKGLLDLSNITTTYISGNVFNKCEKIEHVILPNTITTLQNGVFYQCYGLKQINTSNIISLNYNCFCDCIGLTELDISNVTYIGYNCFKGCTGLINISWPSGVKQIENYVFMNCANLESVGDVSNLEGTIGASAFENCHKLKRLNLSNKITILGDDAFWECNELEEVGDVSNVTTCVDGTFMNCRKLTSLNFSNKLTSIDDRSFVGCGSITSFGDLSGLTGSIGGSFVWCSSITEYPTIKDSTITKLSNTFEKNTSLISIILPETLEELGPDVFYSCTSLQSVYFTSTQPPILDSNSLRSNNATFYVPAVSLELYKTAPIWSNYINRIQPYTTLP